LVAAGLVARDDVKVADDDAAEVEEVLAGAAVPARRGRSLDRVDGGIRSRAAALVEASGFIDRVRELLKTACLTTLDPRGPGGHPDAALIGG
jgi:hypothetical protein